MVLQCRRMDSKAKQAALGASLARGKFPWLYFLLQQEVLTGPEADLLLHTMGPFTIRQDIHGHAIPKYAWSHWHWSDSLF